MAVTLIDRDGKSNVKLPNGEKKAIEYKYRKIVTPASKRGGSETAQYPTFAELADFLGGRIEFELDANGQPKHGCLVGYAIDGWNAEANRNAMAQAANDPVIAKAKFLEQARDMAGKLGMDVDTFLASLQG